MTTVKIDNNKWSEFCKSSNELGCKLYENLYSTVLWLKYNTWNAVRKFRKFSKPTWHFPKMCSLLSNLICWCHYCRSLKLLLVVDTLSRTCAGAGELKPVIFYFWNRSVKQRLWWWTDVNEQSDTIWELIW